MVFGFFEGKINLDLQGKTNFFFGETISGQLVLSLRKPKQARQLRIVLQGTEIFTHPSTVFRNGRQVTEMRTESIVVFSTEEILDNEKTYSSGETRYDFSIQAPAQAFARPKLESTLGNVLNVMQTFSGNRSRIKWELKASLDVPGSVDVSKNLQISLA
ncbi:MAG: hypothetical protein PHD95_03870 [Candidatus ainarchaeum sp.]|nr:hypothetical protein [Candidatus ainarchaeum sp.]